MRQGELHSRARVRQLLLWLVLTCLVPGLIGIGVLIERMYRDDRQQTEKDTIRTARAMALAVDAALAQAQSVAVAVATSGLLGMDDLQPFHDRASALLRSEGIGENIVLNDAGGQQLLNTLRPFGDPLPKHGNPDQLKRVFESALPAISDVFVSGTTGKPIVTVDVPVFAHGKVVSGLSIVLALESFGDLLQKQNLPADWVSSISDRSGTTVARSRQADRLVGTRANPELLQHLQAAAEGAFDTVTRDGIESVVAFSRSPASGWTVAIAIPQALLLAPWKEKLLQIGAGMLVLFALGCYLAWRQGGRIAVSVQRLTDAALAMQKDKTPAMPRLYFAEAEIAVQAIQRGARALADRERARIEAHDALHASKSKLDAALGSMSDAVFISDAGGRFVEINDAFAAFHRFTDKEACRKSLAEYPEILEVFMSDGTLAPLDQWAIPRALRGESGSNVRYRLRRKDTGECWFASYSFAPIRATDGSIVGSVVVGRDITEQEEREQSLAQAHARLGLAQRAAGAGLWEWDIAADTMAWSDEMFGLFRLDPLETRPSFDAWLELVHPEDRAQAREDTLAAVRDHRPLSIRYRIVLPSGDLRWIDAYGDTVYDAQGRGLRLSGICIDATLRQQADDDRLKLLRLEAENRQILESTQLKSQFFANMSHELRTPLGAIIGFADLLHAGAVDEDAAKRHRFVDHIRTSARHLLRLINDVLDLSKFDSGEFEFFPEPVDLRALVTEVQDVLYPSMLAKRVGLSVDVDPRLVGLVLDPARLKQLLYNYLSNAIKFSVDGGHVDLRAMPTGAAYFCIEVEDRGIGIAAADLPRLFVDFQQLDAGYAKRYQGTGLGLALTRRLVQAQGGTVGARSTLGIGSVFFAVLKRVDERQSGSLDGSKPPTQCS